MLSEDDLLDGHADGYQVIYVTQQFLHSKAIKALTQFAEKGGTVIGLCGGGMYDEYQRLNPEAEKLWGASGPVIDKDEKSPMILAKQDLPRYQPLDTVRFAAGNNETPVIAWKQPLKPVQSGSNSVTATFADGSPAAVENHVGRGRAMLFGFLPATAYMKSALPVRPMDRASTDAGYDHFCPTDMDVKLRAALVDAFLPVGFQRPVIVSQNSIDKTPPLVITDPQTDAAPNTQKSIVESTRIITKDKNGTVTRMAVTLVNFTGKPIADLNITLADLPATPKSIKSVDQGGVKFTSQKGTAQLHLPIDVADMLLIDF
jgi:putative intracellular protease/amidase